LDPLTDLVTWLEYYSAIDYVVSLLTTRHGLTAAAARSRARSIGPHARLAREYIEQALTGPRDVAFLPIYYAILNLVKIYILFGSHHALLPANRWHGATYAGYSKESQTLLTEKITVKPGGTLPLFYETITGQRIRKDTHLELGEIYPYLQDVSTEYQLASGESAKLTLLSFNIAKVGDQQCLGAKVRLPPGVAVPNVRQLKALVSFRKHAAQPDVFLSRPIAGTLPAQIRPHLRPYLLYTDIDGSTACPISGSHLLFPEEFPIALAFFHMSSVVRYKPEFLARLKDSRYWPVLSSARRHCLLKFLVSFWAFTHRKTLIIHR
jgi:hypothetical protein